MLNLTLHTEETRARQLVLKKERFTVLDDVMYYIDHGPQHRMRVAVPVSLQKTVMEKNPLWTFWVAARGLLKH